MTDPGPYPPADFDLFWQSTTREALESPLDYSLSSKEQRPQPTDEGQTKPGKVSDRHSIHLLRFRGVVGEDLNGWVALPKESLVKSPGFLWIAHYGRESAMPSQYGTREGFASLSFNFFGLPAYHQEKYAPTRGYFAEGVLDKATWIFRRMFQNAVLAVRVLSDLPQVDGTRVGSMGMSQGAGISIWLGAWCDLVAAVCADMPFLGAMHETLLKNVYRYPLKELMDFMAGVPRGQERVLETISYYDTLNQATRCFKPTLVSVGLKDPAVKPVQARAIYDALPGPKKLVTYDWGHDWHPDMVGNNRIWLQENLT